MDQRRREARNYAGWLWNAKTGVPQYLLSRWPGFSVCGNRGKNTGSLSRRAYQQADRSLANPLKVQAVQALGHKFLVCWVIPGQWALFLLHGNPVCTLSLLPHEAASGPYYRDTAVAVRRKMLTGAEVGDSQMKIVYTLIRSGLASLCILLLGNIFRFRAIIYVMEDRN